MTNASRHPLFGKTSQTLGVMLVLLAVPYTHSSMRKFRIVHAPWDRTADESVASSILTPSASVGETTLARETENHATITNALPLERTPLDPEILAQTAGSVAIVDPTGHSLDAFYLALAATIRHDPGAVTRILHYGDSVIASDYISGTMRRRMQQRFGDGGHGFILIANPWEWYFHNDVDHRASDGWTMSRITGPLASDGFYGLGGVSFHTTTSATATFGTVSRGDFGKAVSRYDIFYLEQPWGGSFQVEIKGRSVERVSTRGDTKISRKKTIDVPDGASQMTIRTLGGGDVRMFGVALERESGATYDALGALGGRAILWKAMNAEHWKEQIELRDPALIVIQYGTNESEAGKVVNTEYERALGNLIETLKTAAPRASILVAAPLDRAEQSENGVLKSSKVIMQIVDLQKQIAKDHGVAFWNTFEAMGGEGSMPKWVKKGLAGGDLTHPSPEGAQIIGDLFFTALTTGYDAYASTHLTVPIRDASSE